MSSNTQFTERRVKESGYVSLGQRNETNRSVLAIARGKTLKKALKRGREEIQPLIHAGEPIQKKAKQIQGKMKCKVMMREVFEQCQFHDSVQSSPKEKEKKIEEKQREKQRNKDTTQLTCTKIRKISFSFKNMPLLKRVCKIL